MGFEPTTASLEGWNSTTELRPPGFSSANQAAVLSARAITNPPVRQARFGGQARIRTLEDISQQIYSLPPLATWVPARRHQHPKTQNILKRKTDHPEHSKPVFWHPETGWLTQGGNGFIFRNAELYVAS